MSTSIYIQEFDYQDLFNQVTNITEGKVPEGRSVEDFFVRVLPNFGHRNGDSFYVQMSEYFEEYNAAYQLLEAINLYFGISGTWLNRFRYPNSSANAHEVLEDLGIEPIEVEDV